jgi:tetratricopeptide (TPR) repeat protein
MDLARRALQVAGDDPNVLSSAGFTLAYFGEDIDVGIAFLDRALRLNPSCAGRWAAEGWLRLWVGQPDLAIERFQKLLAPRPAQAEDRRGSLFRASI